MDVSAAQHRRVVTIRPRREDDADALVAALAQVHESDAYPMMPEHVSREWLYDPGFAGAWVAEVDGAVVGQIAAVNGYGGPDVERASGRPTAETVGITRFFVGHGGRGSGAASALLDAVDDYAAAHGYAVALDVLEFNTAAIALYERRGFRRIGSYAAQWFGPDGPRPTVFLYVR